LEPKFRSVIIAHDMTKLQYSSIKHCKALVEEARQCTQNALGDWIQQVRGSPGHRLPFSVITVPSVNSF